MRWLFALQMEPGTKGRPRERESRGALFTVLFLLNKQYVSGLPFVHPHRLPLFHGPSFSPATVNNGRVRPSARGSLMLSGPGRLARLFFFFILRTPTAANCDIVFKSS